LIVVDVIGNLHWHDFDIDWLDVVVSESYVALSNFDNGSVIIESLMLCGRNAFSLNLLDLHSDVTFGLNLN